MNLLGSCIGPEKIDLEYKEFCFKYLPHDYFSEEDIMNITHGYWNTKLNDIILQNIKIYIKLYVSKCISAFCNSNINGSLLIGCNDWGEITGIPYLIKSNDDFKVLKNTITRSIHDELSTNLSSCVPIDVKIQKLDVNHIFLEDDLMPLMKSYRKKIKEYVTQNEIYTLKKKEWMKDVLKYSAKLHILLNTPDIRDELIKHLVENDANERIITLLKMNKYIPPPSGSEMKSAREFEDPSTLAYWLAVFKDTKLDYIMKCKPKRPRKNIPQNPYMMLHRLSLFRYRFSKNSDASFISIKITVKKDATRHPIKYKDTQLKRWVSNVRLFKKNGPCHEIVYDENGNNDNNDIV